MRIVTKMLARALNADQFSEAEVRRSAWPVLEEVLVDAGRPPGGVVGARPISRLTPRDVERRLRAHAVIRSRAADELLDVPGALSPVDRADPRHETTAQLVSLDHRLRCRGYGEAHDDGGQDRCRDEARGSSGSSWSWAGSPTRRTRLAGLVPAEPTRLTPPGPGLRARSRVYASPPGLVLSCVTCVDLGPKLPFSHAWAHAKPHPGKVGSARRAQEDRATRSEADSDHPSPTDRHPATGPGSARRPVPGRATGPTDPKARA